MSHPKFHKIKIRLGNNQEFETYSTTGKEGDVISVPENFEEHMAWKKTGVTGAKKSDQNIQDFEKRYGNISFGRKKKAEDSENK